MGKNWFPAILPTEPADDAVVEFASTHFLVCRTGFDSPAFEGWSLVSLVSKDLVFSYRLVGITAAFVMVVLTLVFVGSNVYIKDEANRTCVSEARFRAMFDAAPEAVFVFDPETGSIVDANPYMAKWLDYGLEELIGMQIDQILAPEEANTQQGISLLQEGAVPHQRYRRKDGVLMNVETTRAGILLRDQVRELVFVRDITARKQVEELHRIRLELFEFSASHSLEALLQKILDEVGALTNSPIGFYHFVESDQKTLTLQAWSTRTVKEFCNAEGKGLHYNIDQAGVWVDCVHERRPVIHNDYSVLPHRKGMPEGHAAVIRELVVPIMRSGRIVAILGIGNKPEDYTEKDVESVSFLGDVAWTITERKLAQEALSESHRELHETVLQLEQSRNMLQLVVESIPLRVFWKDRDSRYLGCNTLFARDAGLSRTEELLGLDDFAMGWREQAEFYRADDRKVMESGLPRLNIVERQSTPSGARSG